MHVEHILREIDAHDGHFKMDATRSPLQVIPVVIFIGQLWRAHRSCTGSASGAGRRRRRARASTGGRGRGRGLAEGRQVAVPKFTCRELDGLDGTLDYPPAGSPDEGTQDHYRATTQGKAVAGVWRGHSGGAACPRARNRAEDRTRDGPRGCGQSAMSPARSSQPDGTAPSVAMIPARPDYARRQDAPSDSPPKELARSAPVHPRSALARSRPYRGPMETPRMTMN